MTDLQAEARALGDPTRHELFRDIASAGRPLDGLAESLDRLVDAIERHAPPRASCGLRCHVEPRRTDAG